MDPLPDRSTLTQIKQYKIVRELGRGAMGTVYEGVDARDGSRVALKILHPELAASDPTFRDRFEREAHVAALLRSPYTVHLNDFGVANGIYFLVMEYVEGEALSQALAGGALEPARALQVAIAVARALEEADARGVVHRDIKPDNILLAEDGGVKVADFGIARQEGGAGATVVGGYVGTPAYSAPEQARGDADSRTDIYALGATLYCMLVGHPPFTGSSGREVLYQHQYSPVPMAPLAWLPDAITNPIRRCLEKDPRDRYQGASELAGALERATRTLTISGVQLQRPAPEPLPAPVSAPATPLPPPPAPLLPASAAALDETLDVPPLVAASLAEEPTVSLSAPVPGETLVPAATTTVAPAVPVTVIPAAAATVVAASTAIPASAASPAATEVSLASPRMVASPSDTSNAAAAAGAAATVVAVGAVSAGSATGRAVAPPPTAVAADGQPPRRRSRTMLFMLGGAAIIALAAAGAAFAIAGGGGGNSPAAPPPTATPTHSASAVTDSSPSATASPSSQPGDSGSPTAPPPPGASPTTPPNNGGGQQQQPTAPPSNGGGNNGGGGVVIPTPIPPTATPIPPTATPIPPTATPVPVVILVFKYFYVAGPSDPQPQNGVDFDPPQGYPLYSNGATVDACNRIITGIYGFSHSDSAAYTAPRRVVVDYYWYWSQTLQTPVGSPWTVRRDPTWYGITNFGVKGLPLGTYELDLKDEVSGTSTAARITLVCQ